jgi:hypothetical protein
MYRNIYVATRRILTMKRHTGFSEVMIVNPIDSTNQGERLMYFHNAVPPAMGYYGEPPVDYGYFAQVPEYGNYGEVEQLYGFADPYGYYYGEAPEMVGWGDPYGYGQVEPGYFAAAPMGYYAETPADYYGGYAGGYGEYPEAGYGDYGEMDWYGETPEMYGYDGYGEYETPIAEYPEMGSYAETDMSGYVRETDPAFNARCGCAANVSGYDEAPEWGEGPDLQGYVQPGTVNATCEKFAPQPSSPPAMPETLKPLW